MAYEVLANKFTDLDKRIKRITNKLDKHNVKYCYSVGVPYIKEVTISTEEKLTKMNVEVIPFEFSMEELKLGNYTVIGVIDHELFPLNKSNTVYSIGNIVLDIKWDKATSYCEHCNSNRQRKTTVLLQDIEGNIKQVGTSCVKEYTGISTSDVVGYCQEITELIYNIKDVDKQEFTGNEIYYQETFEYLAYCINEIENNGYSTSTKVKAWFKLLDKVTISQSHYVKAREVMGYFNNQEFSSYDTFFNDTKKLLRNKYIKQFTGIIAYSMLLYKKRIEKDKLEKLKIPSEYQGIVGNKITVDVEVIKAISYETMYGVQVIHIMIDENGNIYKWNTKTSLKEGFYTITGKIKEHTIYNKEKQTVLTRCKAVKILNKAV